MPAATYTLMRNRSGRGAADGGYGLAGHQIPRARAPTTLRAEPLSQI